MSSTMGVTGVHRLSNGMQVLTRELHHAPVVAVMVWYGVGSRNEGPGETGISHFLEHMLFKGTPAFPYGALEQGVKERGGLWNAFTSHDYTAYYEILPSRHLAYGLRLEADRMANVTFDEALTMRERGIIVAEREGSENRPDFWLFSSLMQTAFQVSPYRHEILGSKEDIKGVTAAALTAHYQRYYRPGNATLVVVGDFQTEELLRLAEEAFGQLDPGEPIPPLTFHEPEQTAERRVEVRRPGPTPRLMAGYKLPPADHPDMPALAVLSAVLSGQTGFGGAAGLGTSSRLYRKIVSGGLGTGVSTSPWTAQDGGLFIVGAAPTPTTTPAQLEEAIWAEIDRLQQELVPAEEFARAQKAARAAWAYALESIPNHAVLLGRTALTQGVAAFDARLERLAAVTPADLQRVAQTYLVPARRTVAWFHPDETAEEPPVPYTPPEPPEGAKTPAYQLPGSERSATAGARTKVERLTVETRRPLLNQANLVRRTLPGGATLLVYRAPSLPSVLVRLTCEAGAVHDGEVPGLANLTAHLLPRGTAKRRGDDLAVLTDGLGIALQVDAGRETAIAQVKALPEDLNEAVRILAEFVTSPTFPQEELDRMRARALVGLRQAENDPRMVAGRRLAALLYPLGHPYRMPVGGTEEGLKAVTREALLAFHRAHWAPAGAVFTVIGPVDPEAVAEAVSEAFAGWAGGEGRPTIPPVEWTGPKRQHVTIPGKSQTDIALGWPLVARAHPDFLPLELLATLFGGNGTPAASRLFRDLREKHGLSYYQYALFGPASGPAGWTVQMGVNPSRVEEAIHRLRAELARLASEPVPAEELESLKAFLTDYPAVQLESTERLGARLTEAERFGLGVDWVDRYPALVQAITPEQLQAVAATYLQPDQLAIVTAGADPT
jgi:zinc protease